MDVGSEVSSISKLTDPWRIIQQNHPWIAFLPTLPHQAKAHG